MHCRSCGHALSAEVVDLGLSPPSNALTAPDALGRGEMFYPLHAFVCERCYLVQLDKFASPDELFRDYRYFSSYSTTWLAHAKSYADEMTRRGIGPRSRVVEVASNDGYLLRNFVARGVPVLGIEPASAKVSLIPQNYVKLEGKQAQQMLKLMEAIDDHDDVQQVWSNFDTEEKEIEASLA